MAGINGGFTGQGQDFFSDAGDQHVAVTAGQVPSTHAIGKENIPAEKLVLGRERDELETGTQFVSSNQRIGGFQVLGNQTTMGIWWRQTRAGSEKLPQGRC